MDAGITFPTREVNYANVFDAIFEACGNYIRINATGAEQNNPSSSSSCSFSFFSSLFGTLRHGKEGITRAEHCVEYAIEEGDVQILLTHLEGVFNESGNDPKLSLKPLLIESLEAKFGKSDKKLGPAAYLKSLKQSSRPSVRGTHIPCLDRDEYSSLGALLDSYYECIHPKLIPSKAPVIKMAIRDLYQNNLLSSRNLYRLLNIDPDNFESLKNTAKAISTLAAAKLLNMSNFETLFSHTNEMESFCSILRSLNYGNILDDAHFLRVCKLDKDGIQSLAPALRLLYDHSIVTDFNFKILTASDPSYMMNTAKNAVEEKKRRQTAVREF